MTRIENPAFWQDHPDVDVVRVGDDFYTSSSSFHLSPGAPVLRSRDLQHWEPVGHSVPRLAAFGDAYALSADGTGEGAYVRGIWASFFGHRPTDGRFFWGCGIDGHGTHVYSAPAAHGPWEPVAVLDRFCYDPGLLLDDDGTPYLAHGNTDLYVTQLTADLTAEVRHEQVFRTPPEIGVLEGSRFYRRGDAYYLWVTRPANGQYVLRSTTGPFGPYELREVLLDLPGPIDGGGVPHQGGLVRTAGDRWYYQAFVDAYPGGRVPVVAPVRWTDDGWPQVVTVDGRWAVDYPAPDLPTHDRDLAPMHGPEDFRGPALPARFEWNHDPDDDAWSLHDGLRLRTATVTDDLYRARNTLTHRVVGPASTATVEIDAGGLHEGDRTGLVLLRDLSAWVGVVREQGRLRLVRVDGAELRPGDDGRWRTVSTGERVADLDLPGESVTLRVHVDVRPGVGRQATFAWSPDGGELVPLGEPFTLAHDWPFFLGYRFGVFAHATLARGGGSVVHRFDVTPT